MSPHAFGDRIVRRWLIVTALAVAATVVVGGGTRLTESGLSITEWKPVTGVVPPFSEAAWNEAYQQYRQIPEAQTVHAGITLDEFKGLYWWEWAHRLVARLVGLVIVLPFVAFWWGGFIPKHLTLRLTLLPLLVLAQGALGWYMVKSGLSVRTSVSPYRLVAHLGLALVIFGIAVWTAAAMRVRSEPDERTTRGRAALIGLTTLVAVTIASGGFVAGLDAGRIFNEFPLMGGRLFPQGYGALGSWRDFFENPIAAQFNHRLLAVTTVVAALVTWWTAERSAWADRVRWWMRAAAVIALAQATLGVATLLLVVPVGLGVAHQLGAVVLLAALLIGAEAATGTRPA